MYPRVPGQASRSASRQFGLPSLLEKVPESAARATVERCRSVIALTGWAETVNPKASSCHSLRDFIESSVPANARWAIERFKSDDEGEVWQMRLKGVVVWE